MKKQLLIASIFIIASITSVSYAQSIHFKTGNKTLSVNNTSTQELSTYKDERTFVKHPNVYFFPQQISTKLHVALLDVFYQGAKNLFTNNYVYMERKRIGNAFNFCSYDAVSNVKKILFTEQNCPVLGKALKPIGFISANELIVEALVFDSHLDHEGIYLLNMQTLAVAQINVDAKYIASPILSPDLTKLYYISTTDAIKDVIHGNYNVLMTYNLSAYLNKNAGYKLNGNLNNTIYTASNHTNIMLMGWEATTPSLQQQLISFNAAVSSMPLVQYLLSFDSLTSYYVSRTWTGQPSGPHTSIGYSAAYVGFTPHGYPAVDFDTPDTQDDNILATAPGTIVYAGIVPGGINTGYGRLCVIEHANGNRTFNGHMSSLAVSVGDCVGYGTILGKEGTTGTSTGDHQHYEWRGPGGNAWGQGASSVQSNMDDVGYPQEGYLYESKTPTLACNVTNPYSTGPTDVISPTTTVAVPSGFVNANFTANFTDDDNTGGSGVEKAFYTVADNNGAEWSANKNRGFLMDDFTTTINPDWTVNTGTWNINSQKLEQTNQSLSNTSISCMVNSSLSNRYLYEFDAKVTGTGANRRAGLHYFSDNATLPNRGNGYFAWFRIDDGTIEIYKVTNDVFSLMSTSNYAFTAGAYYNFKISYDRVTGKTQVFVNNTLQLTWKDLTPYFTGDYVSFRNGESVFTIDNIAIYRSRLIASTVQVGATGDIRYNNSAINNPAGRVTSIINDVAGNISIASVQLVNVDASIPSAITTVNDGTGIDVDLTSSTSTFSGNFTPSTDVNSGVVKYYYSLGTSAGATNTVPWTANGLSTTVTVASVVLIPNTMYYLNIKSENGAGLFSTVASSDGFMVQTNSNAPNANFTVANSTVCSIDSVLYTNQSTNGTSFKWLFPGGSPSFSTITNPKVYYGATGTYNATLIAYNGTMSDTIKIAKSITVNASPVAVISPSAVSVDVSTGAVVTFTNLSSNATVYNWLFGDGGVSTDVSPVYAYSAAGVYTVVLIANNALCGPITTSVNITVTNVNAINTVGNNINSFAIVYPIQGNSISIIATKNELALCQISTIDGKLLAQSNIQLKENETTNLPLNTVLAKGVYIIKIGTISKKINVL
jgi:murein DD-endopeptidase MepM/ murein hydrolase activator NlpD/PKD repeat protein